MRQIRRIVLASLLCLLLMVSFASAQVLDHVPSGAMVVVKVNNLQAVSQKVADLSQTLGLTEFVPDLQNPLDALQTHSKIQQGLNKSGDAAMAILDAAQTNVPQNKSMIILLPVSDYKQFLGNFPDAQTDGGISTIQFASNPQPSYVTQWGDYAAISPSKELLATKPDGLKASGLAAKELQDKDVIAYVNMPVVKTKALPELQKNRQMIMTQMEQAFKNNPNMNANQLPLMCAIVGEVLDFAQHFLNDSQAATYGIELSKDGITTTMAAQFTPDSHLDKLIQGAKNSDQPMMAGLPDQKYLFYGGMVLDPQWAGRVFDDVTGPVSKELADQGDTGKSIQTLLDSYRLMLTSVESESMGWVVPSGAIGTSGLLQTYCVLHGDSAKIRQSDQQMIQSQQDLMKDLGTAGQQVTTVYTPNAKTVDNVAFDNFHVTFKVDPNNPAAQPATQIMNVFYGPDGLNGYIGQIDPKTLIVAAGGTDDSLSTLIASAKSNDDPLDKQAVVQQVNGQLPKSRMAAMYIPFDSIISTALNYAKMFGFAMPVQLPAGLPPVGVTVGTESNAVRIDSHVPAQLVQSVIQASMQVYMQFHQKAAPAGGGAPDNGGL